MQCFGRGSCKVELTAFCRGLEDSGRLMEQFVPDRGCAIFQIVGHPPQFLPILVEDCAVESSALVLDIRPRGFRHLGSEPEVWGRFIGGWIRG